MLTTIWDYNQLRLQPVGYNQPWLQQLGNTKHCCWLSNLQKVTQGIGGRAGPEPCSFNSASSSPTHLPGGTPSSRASDQEELSGQPFPLNCISEKRDLSLSVVHFNAEQQVLW